MGQGARSKGQGARGKGHGARSKGQGAWGREQGARGREQGAGSKGHGEKGGKCLRHIDCDFQPTNSTFAKMSRMTEKDYKLILNGILNRITIMKLLKPCFFQGDSFIAFLCAIFPSKKHSNDLL
jgi:hypothetical protein